MKEKINQIITALMDLEAKGCHRIFFEYGNSLFRVRIFRAESETVVYEKIINLVQEQDGLDELYGKIEDMKNHIKTTVFQCYRQDYVNGKRSGKWEKTRPVIEFGDNATQSMLIDCSGYYLDDPDNGVLYFVDMKQESEN
ncbi:MAG: hypothetical protein LBS55_12825 [Prevotellaceae bacterium]|nr:hypothetical protein [Prevotellaceae bacterium]